MEKYKYISLKTLCKAIGIQYMRVYNNLRIPKQDTLSPKEKTDLIKELDEGVAQFKKLLS